MVELELPRLRRWEWTLAAVLLWGLLIGVFYRLNGGDLAAGLRTGSLAAAAIVFLVMYRYSRLAATMLMAAALWGVIAVESAINADVRPGDQVVMLAAGVIFAVGAGACAVGVRRARSNARRRVWMAGGVWSAQFLILALVMYLSDDHRVGWAVGGTAVLMLAISDIVIVGYSVQFPDVANAWLAAVAYRPDTRTLRPAFRWLSLAAGLVSGAFTIFMFVKGNVGTRIELSIICCPSTLAMVALAMGAPSLAGAIMRGSHQAHSLRGPDERR